MIDQVFPETLKILADLVRFQTVSGTPNLKLIEYCEKKLNEVGATSFKTFHKSGLQANLFSTINGKEKLNNGGIMSYPIQMNDAAAVSQVINHLSTGVPKEMALRELVINLSLIHI